MLATAELATIQIDTVKIYQSLSRFIDWLDRYGETSWDHQSYFAGPVGRAAKALYYRSQLLGTLAVAPMIFSEAFVPSARRFFAGKQRFPIADAHYAMGFAMLARTLNEDRYYERAVHFLEVLKETRTPGFENYCWGYPFDWVTRNGTFKARTPFITSVPYVYEAFSEVYRIDGSAEWRDVMQSIAEHAYHDYYDMPISETASSCSYTPSKDDPCGVINASAYRAFVLTKAGLDFGRDDYLQTAERNLSFVVESQNSNGSWFYSIDGERDFVDHFHTCFVMKALAKIEALTGNPRCTAAIERGVDYYLANLFDEHGQPKPFSKRPRLTVYKNELYDYAECLNLCALLSGRFSKLDETLYRLSNFDAWLKPDGSFRARKLYLGWDNTPMHRWAQSQMFRSLCFLVSRSPEAAKN
jgi:hypothetical protein